MSDAPTTPGEPGYANQPVGDDGEAMGAGRRTSSGPPVPGTNQAKAEPIGRGNTSTGTGEGHGGSVGSGQPEDVPSGGAAAPRGGHSGDVRGAVGAGTSHLQPQRYGETPEPIATDDAAGARAASPLAGGTGIETTGSDAGATYGLQREAMPGTVEEAQQAPGVRRPAHESGGSAASGTPGGSPVAPTNVRRTGHGTGSSAATRGEALQPVVEQTQTSSPEPRDTANRPVTGVHRPAAPNGEVGRD